MEKRYWRQKLISLREALLELEGGRDDSIKPVELDQQKVGRLSRMDALQSQAMNKAVSARRHQMISKIRASLKRLAENEYGYCLSCGENIAKERLELDPTCLYCINCQTEHGRR